MEAEYEILSARYANDDSTAIELQTKGFGAVIVSLDRAELWAHAQNWIGKGNNPTAYAQSVTEAPRDPLAELDELKAALVAKSVLAESDVAMVKEAIR